MADIELVIKISEEQYEKILNIGNFISADATQLIRDGIPLPKDNEDTISRSDTIDAIGHGTTYTSAELQRIIKGLSPVYPQPKTGYWIRELIRNEKGGCIGAEMICSECGNDNKHDEYMSYCPHCGVEMSKTPTGSESEE